MTLHLTLIFAQFALFSFPLASLPLYLPFLTFLSSLLFTLLPVDLFFFLLMLPLHNLPIYSYFFPHLAFTSRLAHLPSIPHLVLTCPSYPPPAHLIPCLVSTCPPSTLPAHTTLPAPYLSHSTCPLSFHFSPCQHLSNLPTVRIPLFLPHQHLSTLPTTCPHFTLTTPPVDLPSIPHLAHTCPISFLTLSPPLYLGHYLLTLYLTHSTCSLAFHFSPCPYLSNLTTVCIPHYLPHLRYLATLSSPHLTLITPPVHLPSISHLANTCNTHLPTYL